MNTKERILSEIGGLQRTRQYADEIEWQVLTNQISHLFELYDKLDKEEQAEALRQAVIRRRLAEDNGAALCWNDLEGGK